MQKTKSLSVLKNLTTVEITEFAFFSIVEPGCKIVKTEELEHARKVHYCVDGQKLISVHNFLSEITQYYLTDINA
jgi:hypothetical protein